MASKKSKILAIAFCAAVMAGIQVNPVLAAYKFDTDTHVKAGPAAVDQETGKVTMDLVNKENTKVVGKVTIDGLASDKELGEVEDKADQALKENQKQDERLDKVEDKIEGHTNQISSIGKELDDLKESDELQDATLEGHTNQISSIGKELNDLKESDEAQDATLNCRMQRLKVIQIKLVQLEKNLMI